MKKFSEIKETFLREEPDMEIRPKSDKVRQIEEFAHNKNKRTEVINAWTKISDHPKAEDMKSEVGSAFDERDLDDDMAAAYEAIGEGGMVYASFENSFWIRHKGQLIRVM